VADSYFTGLKCGRGDDCSNHGTIVVWWYQAFVFADRNQNL